MKEKNDDERKSLSCPQNQREQVPGLAGALVSVGIPDQRYLKHLVRRPKYLQAILRNQQRWMQQLCYAVENQTRDFHYYLEVVKSCQAQTEKLLRHELERHCLHPALDTIVLLAEELDRLHSLIPTGLPETEHHKDWMILAQELQISLSVAVDKLADLRLERIIPALGTELNPQEHLLRGSTPTTDQVLHGRISQVISPGLIYQGTILRPAKVFVYQYSDKTKIESNKERKEQ
jgi:hypothetical protein